MGLTCSNNQTLSSYASSHTRESLGESGPGMCQVSTGGCTMDTSVFWASNMLTRPVMLLSQPLHHLNNMLPCSKHVDCTQLQHFDTHTAVFAHVASRLATTDSHRSAIDANRASLGQN